MATITATFATREYADRLARRVRLTIAALVGAVVLFAATSAFAQLGGGGTCSNCQILLDCTQNTGCGSIKCYNDNDRDGYGRTNVSVCFSGSCGTCESMGYASRVGDCNELDASINPGATEQCNGIDDDCDGSIDEGVGGTYYRDSDGDGYGDPASSTRSCSRPSGYVTNNNDCNDSRSSVHPGAAEVCNGRDDDCDGSTDEGNPGGGANCSTGKAGVCSSGTTACSGGSVVCQQDTAASSETCDGRDNDCDGSTDEGVKNTYYRDRDGDGYGDASTSTKSCGRPSGYVSNAGDCDDSSGSVHPGATEVCNGVDDNCAGGVDEGVKNTYYADTDGDGYGDPTNSTQACNRPSGYRTNASDCNDSASSVHPGATEVCNGVDDNCSGAVDEGDPGGGVSCSTGQPGVCAAGTTVCSAGSVVCDQNVAASSETCDGRDNDCDGSTDENVKNTYYADTDGDGYGDPASSTQACNRPSGYVRNSGDCDDSAGSVHPGAAEVCNGVDDDCDASTDEGVQSTYWADSDGDGYGNPGASTDACSTPSGYVTNPNDCNDASGSAYPGAAEVCNGQDDNCDGRVDDGDPGGGVSCTTGRPGVCAPGTTVCNGGSIVCQQDVASSGEVCDGKDNDCDGSTDENVTTTYYADGDADGFGVSSSATEACSRPAGYADRAGDCAPSDPDTYPGAASTDSATACMTDADHDGYGSNNPANGATAGNDCDDTNADSHPGLAEVCDGVDQDCDGSVDEYVTTQYFYDGDDDGYGLSTSQYACSPTGNFTATRNGDCRDSDPDINPGVPGSCDPYADPFTYAAKPEATFLIGGDIFASGQSNSLGPAAHQVLDSYWTWGPCPNRWGGTSTCDDLRFGLAMYADNDCSTPLNPMVRPKEDGGAQVEDVLQGIQHRAGEAYCADPNYRPTDQALYAFQRNTFPGLSSANLSVQQTWWDRPHLNMTVIGDLPQSANGANDRVESSLQAACDLYHGDDGTGAGAVPSVPTWVMLSRRYNDDAVPFAGLLAAAGGTGECCYGYGCDPSDPAQQIDVCQHINQSGITEQSIRQDMADGKYNCGEGSYKYQTGGMTFDGSSRHGNLPAMRCHLVGERFNDNCDVNGRKPSDVLGSMACMRQLPQGVTADKVHIEYCFNTGGHHHHHHHHDDDDDENSGRTCVDLTEGDGLNFVNPPENTLFVIDKEVMGVDLCDALNNGVGDVDITITECPNQGNRCQVDGETGRCAAGEIRCRKSGEEYCQRVYDPMPEVCNGLDDDCNGEVDNLSDSWNDFDYHDPEELSQAKYSADGLDRSAIHCFERDVCTCRSDRSFDYAGKDFDAYVQSWTDGICQCGSSLQESAPSSSAAQPTWSEPSSSAAEEASGVDNPTPTPANGQPQAACTAAPTPTRPGAWGVWTALVAGFGLWWRRRRRQ